jgi:hypothetical protein
MEWRSFDERQCGCATLTAIINHVHGFHLWNLSPPFAAVRHCVQSGYVGQDRRVVFA